MPVLLRVLLWLACTALAVTAVFFAVGFVIKSTTPVPALALPTPTVFVAASGEATDDPSALEPPKAPASASPSASPSPKGSSASPSSGVTRAPATVVPRPSPAVTGQRPGPGSSCQGGVGAHTVRSSGGQASINFGNGAVCLVSALPAPGFTTDVTQSEPGTLVVTFTSRDHRSRITATLQPQPQASVRETAL
ncbi:hypothetical protein [Kitasatospora sp. MBT63]|uniref:hypothetical protein n=1 Tax=Kitasatospora sp. MBT63 TaxID=1444768 RepID=UPI001E2851CB|nr:hypothetical protein [Kitasatospora sp. MBT63]